MANFSLESWSAETRRQDIYYLRTAQWELGALGKTHESQDKIWPEYERNEKYDFYLNCKQAEEQGGRNRAPQGFSPRTDNE